jgi:hypothetical protein
MGVHSKFLVETLILVYFHNQSAIHIADIPIAHSEMKHVNIHAHYLRWLVQDNVVNLVYCKIYVQVVDIFIKPLSKSKFVKLQAILGIQEATIMGVCAKVISFTESSEQRKLV